MAKQFWAYLLLMAFSSLQIVLSSIVKYIFKYQKDIHSNEK